MKYDIYEMDDEIEELRKYADEDGPTSMSEEGQCISALARYPDYFSEEFGVALAKEILLQLDYYKKHTKIVETKKTYTHTVSELVHF